MRAPDAQPEDVIASAGYIFLFSWRWGLRSAADIVIAGSLVGDGRFRFSTDPRASAMSFGGAAGLVWWPVKSGNAFMLNVKSGGVRLAQSSATSGFGFA